jgi:RHS repeat-associated protein
MFFDNLQVRHDRSRILEENHYYAYGLKIPSISSKAYGAANNNFQYQGDYSEFDDDLGWNDFELRSYDPQIGRFLQNDPYDQFASGYVGMGNDPVDNVDPSGGFAGMSIGASIATGAVLGGIIGGSIAAFSKNGDGIGKGFLMGMFAGAAIGLGSEMNWAGLGEALGNGLLRAAPGILTSTIGMSKNLTPAQIDNRIKKQGLLDLDRRLKVMSKRLKKWGENEQEDFENHFGSNDNASRQQIQGQIERSRVVIKKYLNKGNYKQNLHRDKLFDNIKEEAIDEPAAVAWRKTSTHYMDLYRGFWNENRKSRMGILAHEISHYLDVGGTRDEGYGVNRCSLLRDFDPHLALKNADNFMYYILGVKLPEFKIQEPSLESLLKIND